MRRRKSKELDYCRLYAVGITITFGVLIILVYVLDPHHAGNKSLLLEAREKSWGGRINSNIKPLPPVDPNVKPILLDVIVPTIGVVVEDPVVAVDDKSIQDTLYELFNLAESDPSELIIRLQEQDPLGINSGPKGFQCPSSSSRIDFPSFVNIENSAHFKEGVDGSFIFYQHLRKAGGTGFCDLANNNLPKDAVPSYYCMPDNRGSLSTPPWNQPEYIMNQMKARNYKIAANEWDVFYDTQADMKDVVLATTIRHPIDRWYSQYRFEHLEHRDGSTSDAKRQSMLEVYNSCKGWTMGTNYYVKTFIGNIDLHPPIQANGDFY
eukprot:CAMPEP_0119034664 /NCGR_PEP_ID=MMETSP1177-20130426/1675_1 /TAXON_ID=2985 /ORGANISM="Ochromonas sp, Strain CCMP1899" /LENGTH=321 /DNA_ID=CAMNT_0006992269 /DNA_START=221 /DNA_END=1183 /DNA_ORIENTATION=+